MTNLRLIVLFIFCISAVISDPSFAITILFFDIAFYQRIDPVDRFIFFFSRLFRQVTCWQINGINLKQRYNTTEEAKNNL